SVLYSRLKYKDSWLTNNPCLSENTEDCDFIISDSESLSEYNNKLKEESKDYIPINNI
ncbi:uncharacterized protein BO88DRAFT_344770, partial [Aspergillus vadensis CBS 113365]